jgi:hypothetical protein
VDDRSVDPATRAGDPFAYVGERKDRSPRPEAELVEAIAEEESRRGYPMIPRERDGFARGFFSTEYRAEVRRLIAFGVVDDEAEE